MPKENTINRQYINIAGVFNIDALNSDEEYLYVDVPGYGTVQVKVQPDGLVVDVFRFNPTENAAADCVATLSASIEDLNPQDDDDKVIPLKPKE